MSLKNFRLKNVAMMLLGLNVLMYIIQASVGPAFTNNLMLISGDILARPWILLSSMFLHAGSMHLLFNMYALLIFGPLIERKVGSKRFLGTYIISGILAGLIYALFNIFVTNTPNAAAVGASGAIMAILGLVIMLLPNLRVLFFFVIPMRMRTAGIIFAAIDLIGMIGPNDGIAHIAHLVGLTCGVLFGLYLVKKKKLFAQSFTQRSGFGPRVKMKMYTSSKKPQGSSQAKKPSSQASGEYGETIELTKDDLDNYFKYGRL